MQFQSLKLGGGGLVFASTHSVRLPFQFPMPVSGAYAILAGTRFEHAQERGSYYSSGPDEEVKIVEVSVLALFDALQSKTGGEVQISFRLPGKTSASAPDLLRAEIDVLVVGI